MHAMMRHIAMSLCVCAGDAVVSNKIDPHAGEIMRPISVFLQSPKPVFDFHCLQAACFSSDQTEL